ncbi:MAG: isoprenyl transferase [Bryobacterales bacterium]|nr:isoprenyl transferase [Bryobacterales bacterium]
MQALVDSLKRGDPDWDLASAIRPERLPAHIAIIMDGNGRWAKQRGLPRVAGHQAGIDSVRTTVETCARIGIQSLTLYAFSLENWKRPRPEVEMLWRLLRIYLHRELPRLQKNNIRLNAIGRWEELAESVRSDLAATIAKTSNNTGMRLNLAINYGGRAELVDAMNRILDEARRNGTLSDLRVDEAMISSRLDTGDLPEPDLLIRTSGEMRISNFLLWQIAYAELYVTETLWPDFNRSHLLRAIEAYQKRDRRFGGLTPSAAEAAEEQLVGVAELPGP